MTTNGPQLLADAIGALLERDPIADDAIDALRSALEEGASVSAIGDVLRDRVGRALLVDGVDARAWKLAAQRQLLDALDAHRGESVRVDLAPGGTLTGKIAGPTQTPAGDGALFVETYTDTTGPPRLVALAADDLHSARLLTLGGSDLGPDVQAARERDARQAERGAVQLRDGAGADALELLGPLVDRLRAIMHEQTGSGLSEAASAREVAIASVREFAATLATPGRRRHVESLAEIIDEIGQLDDDDREEARERGC